MKIAAITDDGQTISAHFGRARHYLVFTVEDGEIVNQALRDKAGHHTFGGEHEHGDHHHHDHQEHEQGHGFGPGAGRRHAEMLAAIQDCDLLLARGMGRGAQIALQEANIQTILTEIKSIEDAVQAYLKGELTHRPERLH